MRAPWDLRTGKLTSLAMCACCHAVPFHSLVVNSYHSILPSVVAELQRVSKFQLEGRRHRNDDDDDTGGHGDGGDGATEDTSELLQFEISDGASCIFLNGRDKPPTIVQKRDGSYLYATTDLAALKQRALSEVIAAAINQSTCTRAPLQRVSFLPNTARGCSLMRCLSLSLFVSLSPSAAVSNKRD